MARRSGSQPGGLATVATVLTLLASTTTGAGAELQTERVVEVRVHGNQRVADADIVTWAAVAVGDHVEPDVASEVEQRLNATGRFEAVEVRKRYLSLTANDEIALIIVVTERPGPASANPITRFLGSFGRQALFLPVFDYTEGYGVTYGGHTSFVDVLGEGGRLSVPARWGGTKRIALEADKVFSSGLITRVQGGVMLSRRENPRFEIDDDRTEGWVQVDRRLPGRLRAEVRAGWADIRFGSLDDTLGRYRVMLELDTRSDQSFPRDAVRARASYEWLDVGDRSSVIGRQSYEVEAFAGLVGQSVLAVRAAYTGADAPVPPYEQSILGGGGSLRGWRVGDFGGDRQASGSVELRFPLTSPLSVGRTGAAVFYDTGAAFDVGQSITDTRFRHGAGVGLFLDTAILHLRLDIAHNIVNAARLHVTAGVSF